MMDGGLAVQVPQPWHHTPPSKGGGLQFVGLLHSGALGWRQRKMPRSSAICTRRARTHADADAHTQTHTRSDAQMQRMHAHPARVGNAGASALRWQRSGTLPLVSAMAITVAGDGWVAAMARISADLSAGFCARLRSRALMVAVSRIPCAGPATLKGGHVSEAGRCT